MDHSERLVLVIDNGSNSVKCGLCDSCYPCVIPTVVGRPIVGTDVNAPDRPVGSEALDFLTNMALEYPFDNRGAIVHWDLMHLVWSAAFNRLQTPQLQLSQCKLLLTESPFGVPNKRKLVEELFEKYQCLAIQFVDEAAMSMYSNGLTSGVVVDAGETGTVVCPVYQGISLRPFAQRFGIGGKRITEYLTKLLLNRGYPMNVGADCERIRYIKERTCYVCLNIEQESLLANDTTSLIDNYKLPNDGVVRLGEERYKAPELLFQPYLIGESGDNLVEIIYKTIEVADMAIRPLLRQHIVLSGGSVLFPGFSTRLERDLKLMFLDRVYKGDSERLKSLAMSIEDHPPWRRYSAFVGAAKLALVKKYDESFWVSMKQYHEEGFNRLEKQLMIHSAS